MWMDEQTKELKERISSLSDDELLNIVEVEFNDYRKDALDFAKGELTRRGIEFEELSKEKETPGEESADIEVGTSWAEACARCGGKARLGVLLVDKEITILFTDKDEQHFLEVYACSQCGHVELVVDYETEVEGR